MQWLQAMRTERQHQLDATDGLQPIADELGASLAQLAIAWAVKHPHVSSVILGATKVEQVGALDHDCCPRDVSCSAVLWNCDGGSCDWHCCMSSGALMVCTMRLIVPYVTILALHEMQQATSKGLHSFVHETRAISAPDTRCCC